MAGERWWMQVRASYTYKSVRAENNNGQNIKIKMVGRRPAWCSGGLVDDQV